MISERVSNVSPSATLKISARAKELKNEGKSIISLSAGEPDFKTPDHVCTAAIQAIENGYHGYTVNTGAIELRKAITHKLKRDNDLDYDPSQIVVSNGAKQSIGFTLLAILNKGDEVVIPAPYWVSYPEMSKMAEAIPVPVRTSFENNYKLTGEQLESAITAQTKALILCSPSNPTGSCYTKVELEDLAVVLRKHPDVLILSDEIYEYINFEGSHVSIINAAPDLKDRVILVNGFSKGFAMTGWRLGYLAAHKDIVAAVSKVQSQETSAPSSISQKAGEAAYTGNLADVERMRAEFKNRRDYIVQALNDIEGIKCFKPEGAFYVFPDVSHYLNTTTPSGTPIHTSTELCLYLLDECGLAIVPGDAFGEPNGVRLSYAAAMSDLEEAIARLKQGLMNLT